MPGARPPVLTRVGQEREGVRAPAARPAAPRAQRSEKGLIPIEFPRIEKRFSRISVASRLYPAKAPGGGPRSVVTRAACRAHPSSRHTRKRCFASRTRRIALKRHNIKHSAGGIAHLYFLSFFLHMRRGNYGTGHSASTCSCKIARFSEHPRSIRRLITFPSFFPHAPLMPVSTRHNHHLVASYRNPPIRVFAAPPWMLSRTFHFTRKGGCTISASTSSCKIARF